MRVKIRFFTRLREITREREEEVEVAKGTTVEELLKMLEEKYGQSFKGYLRDHRGNFRQSLQYLVNGRNVRFLQGLETVLTMDDALAIIPPVGGG
ncbi:MAG: ubiquitin-like small modifier protein 1 [Candidatus Bathyarchaeia archaeon]